MNSLIKKSLVIFCLVLFTISCANLGTAVKEDPYKAAYYSYSQMLKWYTESAESYDIHYNAASPEIQAKWKEDVTPVFLKIKSALDAWKIALGNGFTGEENLDQIKTLKTTLLTYGLTFLEDK